MSASFSRFDSEILRLRIICYKYKKYLVVVVGFPATYIILPVFNPPGIVKVKGKDCNSNKKIDKN